MVYVSGSNNIGEYKYPHLAPGQRPAKSISKAGEAKLHLVAWVGIVFLVAGSYVYTYLKGRADGGNEVQNLADLKREAGEHGVNENLVKAGDMPELRKLYSFLLEEKVERLAGNEGIKYTAEEKQLAACTLMEMLLDRQYGYGENQNEYSKSKLPELVVEYNNQGAMTEVYLAVPGVENDQNTYNKIDNDQSVTKTDIIEKVNKRSAYVFFPETDGYKDGEQTYFYYFEALDDKGKTVRVYANPVSYPLKKE